MTAPIAASLRETPRTDWIAVVRELALRQAMKKRDDPNVQYLVGEMENELATARIALQHIVGAMEQGTLTMRHLHASRINRKETRQ